MEHTAIKFGGANAAVESPVAIARMLSRLICCLSRGTEEALDSVVRFLLKPGDAAAQLRLALFRPTRAVVGGIRDRARLVASFKFGQ